MITDFKQGIPGLAATLFASVTAISACSPNPPEAASNGSPAEARSSAPSCEVSEQQTQLADVVTTLAFNSRVLNELGVTVEWTGATKAAAQHALSIWPGPAKSFAGTSACMAVDVIDGHLEDFLSGRIAHRGGPTLAHGKLGVSLAGFEVRVGSEPRTFDIVTASGERVLLGNLAHYQIDATGMLDVFNVDLTATPALAARWGAPQLAGTVIGTLALRAKVTLPRGGAKSARAAVEKTAAAPALKDCNDFSGDIDVALTRIGSVQQQGRLGDKVVITPSATLKNVGTANVPWQAQFSGSFPPYNVDQHPFLVWSLFREVGGVFAPLGYSDVKHAFLTINNNCAAGSCRIGSVLGLGCEDVYGVGTNGTHLAPRSEILPHAGTWAHCNFPTPGTPSHFDQVAPFCSEDNDGSNEDVLVHRLVASDAELSVAGANYYFAAWYVVRDDINIFNSMGWRKIVPSRNGTTWSFALATAFRAGSVLDAFVDPAAQTPTRVNTTLKDAKGSVQIAATATDLGNGKFSYVYVVMNHDFDPNLGAIALPVGANVTIEQPAFNDGDEDSTNDWTLSRGDGELSWAAPKGTALTWGKAITLSFVASSASSRGNARLTPSDSGAALFVETVLAQ